MLKNRVAGGTHDIKEIIVDYKNQTTEILDVSPATLMNRIGSAYLSWFPRMFIPTLFGIFGLFLVFGDYDAAIRGWFILSVFIPLIVVPLFHANIKFDKKWKIYLAKKTGEGEKNRLVISDFTSKTFVLEDFKNIVLEYEVTGDMATQLEKIHIKEEDSIQCFYRQGKIKDFNSISRELCSKWNAYFYFSKIPKDGELSIRWI